MVNDIILKTLKTTMMPYEDATSYVLGLPNQRQTISTGKGVKKLEPFHTVDQCKMVQQLWKKA